MIIQTKQFFYPEYITWFADLSSKETPFDLFGKSHEKKIRRTMHELDQQDEYVFKIESVTPEYIDLFLPLYTELIQSKKNGVTYDVKGHIISRLKKNIYYETISLYKSEQLIGGFLYCMKDDSITTAYKVFPYSFHSKSFRSSPTMIAEYFLYTRALEEQKKYIQHGRDLNRFGHHSAIGLAIFKLKLGCTPQPSQRQPIIWHDQIDYLGEKDELFFVGTQEKKSIEKMLLFSKKSIGTVQEEYRELFQQTILPIEHIF